MVSETDEPLERSVIHEGWAYRQDIVDKLALWPYIQETDADRLSHLEPELLKATIRSVHELFRVALQSASYVRFRWLSLGFGCGSAEAKTYGDHEYLRGSVMRVESGRAYRGAGISTNEWDMEEERTKMRKEGDKQALYGSESANALRIVSDRIHVLLERSMRYESGDADDVISLLQEARVCHDMLVDFILRYLPGRTFLKT